MKPPNVPALGVSFVAGCPHTCYNTPMTYSPRCPGVAALVRLVKHNPTLAGLLPIYALIFGWLYCCIA